LFLSVFFVDKLSSEFCCVSQHSFSGHCHSVYTGVVLLVHKTGAIWFSLCFLFIY